MAFKLYGIPPSPPCATAMLAAYEKGVEFELVLLDLGKGEHKAPDYLLKQPFGKVPCIQDGGLTLFESRAIARYLAEKYAGQGTDLYPADPAHRAKVNQWTEAGAHNYDRAASALASERWYVPTYLGKPSDEAVVAEQVAKLEAVLDVYEAHLAQNEYLAGDAFSLADLAHMGVTRYLQFAAPADFEKLLASRKCVRRWWDSVCARPAWKKYNALAEEYIKNHCS